MPNVAGMSGTKKSVLTFACLLRFLILYAWHIMQSLVDVIMMLLTDSLTRTVHKNRSTESTQASHDKMQTVSSSDSPFFFFFFLKALLSKHIELET